MGEKYLESQSIQLFSFLLNLDSPLRKSAKDMSALGHA